MNALSQGEEKDELQKLAKWTRAAVATDVSNPPPESFPDSRVELATLVGRTHVVVPTRDRTTRNEARYQVLTYTNDLSHEDTPWLVSQQPCIIGPRENLCNTSGTATAASFALDSLIASGRVQQNELPFELHEVLESAAANTGSRLTCTRLVAGQTKDDTLLGQEVGQVPTQQPAGALWRYILRAEFQVVDSSHSRDASSSPRVQCHEDLDKSNPDVLSWRSTAPIGITVCVNKNLQGDVERHLQIIKVSPSTTLRSRLRSWIASQKGKLSSKKPKPRYPGIETEIEDQHIGLLQGSKRSMGSEERSLALRDFLFEMNPETGMLIFEIRDSRMKAPGSDGPTSGGEEPSTLDSAPERDTASSTR